MRDLTARQQEILDLIRQYISDTGFPPTRAEIAAKLGFRSPNAAEEHLKALARKGVLELTSGASRGIRLKTSAGTGNASASPLGTGLAWVGLNLPLVGRVAAGSPILSQEHIEQHYQLDPSLFREKPDYLLKVRGMSMRDAGILEGDLLAVRQSSEARNGQIVGCTVRVKPSSCCPRTPHSNPSSSMHAPPTSPLKASVWVWCAPTPPSDTAHAFPSPRARHGCHPRPYFSIASSGKRIARGRLASQPTRAWPLPWSAQRVQRPGCPVARGRLACRHTSRAHRS